MRIDCIVGPVGSGKTTLFGLYDPELWVRYGPGSLCRQAVGTGMFRAGDRPNAPEVMDDFVFNGLRAHLDLARRLGRPLVVEFPRTRVQAELFLHHVHKCIPVTHLHVLVQRLHISEATWEARLAAGRWKQDPASEQMDRVRFSQSVQDALEATAYLRTVGSALVTVRELAENTTPEARAPLQYLSRKEPCPSPTSSPAPSDPAPSTSTAPPGPATAGMICHTVAPGSAYGPVPGSKYHWESLSKSQTGFSG